jgi:hypothetical protein
MSVISMLVVDRSLRWGSILMFEFSSSKMTTVANQPPLPLV